MRETKIENAHISRVDIEVEDHGILTMGVWLEGDGWGVMFGGYTLDRWSDEKKRREGTELLAECVLRLLDTFKVGRLSDLSGLPCRVETEGWCGKVQRIGHFTQNRWFSFADTCAEVTGKGK
jgi:hypothetical protein